MTKPPSNKLLITLPPTYRDKLEAIRERLELRSAAQVIRHLIDIHSPKKWPKPMSAVGAITMAQAEAATRAFTGEATPVAPDTEDGAGGSPGPAIEPLAEALPMTPVDLGKPINPVDKKADPWASLVALPVKRPIGSLAKSGGKKK